MMIRPMTFWTMGMSLAFVWLLAPMAPSQAPTSAGLPGARATIDASQFPSLQAAIDAVPPEGGLVNLPAGLFEIREPLRVTQEDIHITGAGTATHIKNLNDAGQPCFLFEPATLAADPKARQWRVQMSNLRLTGNEKSGHGIHARYVQEIFLDGITVSYHGKDGIFLDNCFEDPRVTDCLITYNKQTGLSLLGCHDIVVVGNHFEENQDAIHCIDGFNLCMTGNNVDDHLGNGVVVENTYGSVISGNMIEECQGTAVILRRDVYGITVSSNVIAHHNTGGVELVDAHGCAISANTFVLVKQNGLVVGPGSSRITITGNNFCNSYIGEGSERREKVDSAATGIILKDAKHVAVSGNVFSGLAPGALTLGEQPSQRVLFGQNVIVDAPSQHQGLTNSLVSDNLED
jgi:parallel beta-helix repeat protein